MITFFWQGRPSHRNVVLPNYFLFDKFPGIVQNGKNFIIVVTSKTIYGISTILVLKFWYFGFVGLFSCFVEELSWDIYLHSSRIWRQIWRYFTNNPKLHFLDKQHCLSLTSLGYILIWWKYLCSSLRWFLPHGKLVVKSDRNALEILVKFIISCVSKLKAFSSKLEIRKKSYEYFYKEFVNLNIKK